jgi:DAK2 domain fusion protein YloV
MLALTPAASAATDLEVIWDGEFLRRCLAAAVQLLRRRCVTINNLNVFPVPDGDTGTNMLLTMRSGLMAAADAESRQVGSVASAVARGALLGARGNSGVILSQYLLGFARGLDGCDELGARELCQAFQEASTCARSAVSTPVEGTILTVAADVARAVSARSGVSVEPLDLLEIAVTESKASVGRTREIMPLLRQANVVDSGAMGLATILEGVTLAARGEELPVEDVAEAPAPVALRLEPDAYGYCTEFLVRGPALDSAAIRDQLEFIGNSLLVVGDDDLVRVHIHTFQPGQAIDVALAHGAIDQVKIENMQQQNERIRAGEIDHHAAVALCAQVVVSVGDGFARVYRSLGATVVSGGQTLNPSAEEILQGLRRVDAKEYILLPNNSNVLLTAHQAASLWDRPLTLVPTCNLAEGVAAALAFQPTRSAAENFAAMRRGMADVRTGLVTTAIRSARIGDREIAAGAFLGLIGEQIEAFGTDRMEVALQVLALLGAADCELITLYAGDSATDEDAAELRARVQAAFPNIQADVVDGGQPHQWFILACE